MEVCVDSVESALSAASSGARRLELCSALGEGGLTPSLGLFKVVRDAVRPLPVNILLRPRAGDFCYTDSEIKVMHHDIQLFLSEGASGLVLGVLSPDGTVDRKSCQDLLNSARPLPVTFHRAFDWTPDPLAAMDTLLDLGFRRLLTSGQASTAELGADLISQLVALAGTKMTVMPGGGVTEDNLVSLLEKTGAREFHGSASRFRQSQMNFRPEVSMGGASSDFRWRECCPLRVAKMVALAKGILDKKI